MPSCRVLDSLIRSATTVSEEQANYDAKGLHLIVKIISAPVSGTITPKIQGVINCEVYDILVGNAISAIGTYVYKIYPGISAVSGVSVNDVLPSIWKLEMTHSSNTEFIYTVSANLIN